VSQTVERRASRSRTLNKTAGIADKSVKEKNVRHIENEGENEENGDVEISLIRCGIAGQTTEESGKEVIEPGQKEEKEKKEKRM
jgi:hypothetical protein